MLMEKLSTLDKTDWAALAELGDLSVAVGSARRALEFYRRARKWCAAPEAVRQLEVRIEEVLRDGVPKLPEREY